MGLNMTSAYRRKGGRPVQAPALSAFRDSLYSAFPFPGQSAVANTLSKPTSGYLAQDLLKVFASVQSLPAGVRVSRSDNLDDQTQALSRNYTNGDVSCVTFCAVRGAGSRLA